MTLELSAALDLAEPAKPHRWRKSYPPIEDRILSAKLHTGAAPHSPLRLRGAQAKGKTYERRITKKILPRIFPGEYINVGQWIVYQLADDTAPRRFAQPDALVLQGDVLWIFECKLTHVLEAGGQLVNLYGALCKRIWPYQAQIRIEVCQNYTWLDGGPPLIHQPADIFSTPDSPWYVWHQM